MQNIPFLYGELNKQVEKIPYHFSTGDESGSIKITTEGVTQEVVIKDFDALQLKNDPGLITENKNISGAINEIQQEINSLTEEANNLNLENGGGVDSLVQKVSTIDPTDLDENGNPNDFENVATVDSGVTFGKSNINNGKRSIMAGKLNINNGANSVQAGFGNENSGNCVLEGGQRNTNTASGAVVAGSNNVNNAVNAVVVGSKNVNKKTGSGVIMNGDNGVNTKANSIVGGTWACNHSQNSLNVGYKITIGSEDTSTPCVWAGGSNVEVASEAGYVFAHGGNLQAGHPYQNILGYYNDNKKDTLLELGNGRHVGNRSNAFEVYKDGRAKAYGAPVESNDIVRKQELDNLRTEINNDLIGKVDYLGAVFSSLDIDDSNASSGDYYRSAANFTYNEEEIHVGDLIVYNGVGWDIIHTEEPESIIDLLNIANGEITKYPDYATCLNIRTNDETTTTDFSNEKYEAGTFGVTGYASIGLGKYLRASGNYSQAFGYFNFADGSYSHVEGNNNTVTDTANGAHVEGGANIATGAYAHVEGGGSNGKDSEGNFLHGNIASGMSSHAEGSRNKAEGYYSHAEGYKNLASGDGAHVGGLESTALGNYSIAHGLGTLSGDSYQAVFGRYNENKGNTLFEVGNGTSDTNKSNAFEIYKDGRATIQKTTSNLNDIVNVYYLNSAITDAFDNLNLKNGEGTDSIIQKYSGEVDDTHYGNTSTGARSAVFGDSNTNNATYSLLSGKLNKNSGSNSNVVGYKNTNAGVDAVVGGTNNANNKPNSVVSGADNVNNGSGSLVIGYNNINPRDNAIVGGYNNVENTEALLAIGNGKSDSKRSNAFEVHRDGTARAEKFVTKEVDGVLGAEAKGIQSVAFGGLRYDAVNPDNNNYDRTPTSAEGNQSFSAGGSNHSYGNFTGTIGKDCVAYQEASMAFGGNNTAGISYAEWLTRKGLTDNEENRSTYDNETFGATALGMANKSTGVGSFSVGLENTASGAYSAAIGHKTQATGDRSFAQGAITKASGPSSHASGYGAEATADGAFSHGYATKATHPHSVAFGYTSEAKAPRAFAMGERAYAIHQYSAAFGVDTVTGHLNSFVTGRCNSGNANAIFEVGNGADKENRANAFEVLTDGRAKVYGAPVEDEDVVRLKDLIQIVEDLKFELETKINALSI